MNDWIQLRSDILDHVDGLLSIEKRKKITKIIDEDPKAREFYEETAKLRETLKGLAPIKTSSNFDLLLRSRIQMEKSMNKRFLFNFSNQSSAIFAVAAIAILAFFLAPHFIENKTDKNIFSQKLEPLTTKQALAPSHQAPTSKQSIYYPTDQLISTSRGAAINSKSLNLRNTRSDSLQRKPDDPNIHTVDIEF